MQHVRDTAKLASTSVGEEQATSMFDLRSEVQFHPELCCDAHAPKPTPKEPTEYKDSRKEATPCKYKGLVGMGDTGLEPVTSRV